MPWDVMKAAAEEGIGTLDFMMNDGRRPAGSVRRRSTPKRCTGAAPASRSRSPAPALRPPASPPRAPASRSWSGCPSASPAADELQLGAYAVTEPSGRFRRQVAAHHRQARRRRVGPQRHQGLHHQRRHRRRHGRRRSRRPRARHPRPGLVHRPEGHAGPLARARRKTSSESALRRPPRSCSRTAASRSSTCSAAWTS